MKINMVYVDKLVLPFLMMCENIVGTLMVTMDKITLM